MKVLCEEGQGLVRTDEGAAAEPASRGPTPGAPMEPRSGGRTWDTVERACERAAGSTPAGSTDAPRVAETGSEQVCGYSTSAGASNVEASTAERGESAKGLRVPRSMSRAGSGSPSSPICPMCSQDPPAFRPGGTRDLFVEGGDGELAVRVATALQGDPMDAYAIPQVEPQERLDAAGIDMVVEDHGWHWYVRGRGGHRP